MRFKDVAEFTEWRKRMNIKAPVSKEPLVFSQESKPSKFNNKKVIAPDGQKFDSGLEYGRHKQLELLEKAGEISNLKRQVNLDIFAQTPIGEKVKVCSIRLDATYTEKGEVILEDSKGFLKREQEIKYKLFEITTGRKIRLYSDKIGIWYLKY